MSTTHEVVAALQWYYSVLSGDSALSTQAPGGVYRGVAPPNTATPFVVMAYQAGSDVLTMNAVRLMSSLVFQVKVVGPAADTEALALASSTVDDILKRTSGTTTGGLILACYRESPFQIDELNNGVLWSSFGGLYRSQIQQIPNS
jgi:hypothetical protein